MFDPVSSVFQGVGALVGIDSQRKAANTQADAYASAQAAQQPWQLAGGWSVNELRNKLAEGPGEYTKSPGYDFRLQEGVNALERGAAARGKQLSGAQEKALTRYGQDYATNDYQNWLNRWYDSLKPYQSLAGLGQTSATAAGQFGVGAGQSQAAGYLGQANTINSLMNTYGEGWQTTVAPMSPNTALGMFLGGGQNMMQSMPGMGGAGAGAGASSGWWMNPAVAAVF
jgi:hypothetical protein